MLKLGQNAPPFQAIDQYGKPCRLQDLLQNGPVVLFFFPKSFTPVCTREACSFRDGYAELKRQFGVEVVGVSSDPNSVQGDFSSRYDLPYPMVSDSNKSIARAYDVLAVAGLWNKRVTYVIGRDSIIRGAFHFELRASQHLKEVKKALGSMLD